MLVNKFQSAPKRVRFATDFLPESGVAGHCRPRDALVVSGLKAGGVAPSAARRRLQEPGDHKGPGPVTGPREDGPVAVADPGVLRSTTGAALNPGSSHAVAGQSLIQNEKIPAISKPVRPFRS